MRTIEGRARKKKGRLILRGNWTRRLFPRFANGAPGYAFRERPCKKEGIRMNKKGLKA